MRDAGKLAGRDNRKRHRLVRRHDDVVDHADPVAILIDDRLVENGFLDTPAAEDGCGFLHADAERLRAGNLRLRRKGDLSERCCK